VSVSTPLTDMDVPAVALMAGTSEQHIQSLCRQARIPYYRVGKFYRFNSGEVRRWLESQHVTVEVAK
jgi:excisionase family DNA binding protein